MPKNVDVPGIGVVEFPDSMSDDQVSAAIQAHLNAPPPIAQPHVNMQESPLPGITKFGIDMLPVAGGTAGAVLGAPAAGYGGLVGAGLGAAGGESLRQLLMNK